MTTYSIGYSWEKSLRRMEHSVAEDNAITRLADDCGTADDVRLVAGMLARENLHQSAADLLRMVPPR